MKFHLHKFGKTSLFAAVALILSAMTVRAQETPQKGKPNPQMQAVLDQLTALKGKPMETLSAKEARQQPTPADAVMALLKHQGKSTAPEAVGNVENRTIAGAGGTIPIRIYTPKGEGPFPVIVYYHGGGWVIADLDTYDSSPRALANAAQAVVVSSHYRQAPEHKFPAAHGDAFAAYQWTLKNAESIRGQSQNIAVVGESAGGNLAASVSMMARDRNLQIPVHAVLVYPVAAHDFNTPSYQENANAKPLNKAMMGWFFEKYLSKPEEAKSPMISLVNAPNLKGFPPTTIITAEIDPLRSEGQMLAEKLQQVGVKVNYKNYDGVAHEFFGMGAVLPEAKQAVALAAQDLKGSFQQVREAAGGERKIDLKK